MVMFSIADQGPIEGWALTHAMHHVASEAGHWTVGSPEPGVKFFRKPPFFTWKIHGLPTANDGYCMVEIFLELNPFSMRIMV